jgi:16S rRNA (cytosine967-C5)-methyltransferase
MLDCRVAAAQILAAVCGQGQSLERQLARFESSVRERDRGLLRELCYGSLRWYPRLSALLDLLLQKPLKERDADVRAALIIGAYQILFTRIPEHAAISTAVEACRSLQKNWATGLVNGVLRTLQRNHTSLIEKLPAAALAAHPDWLWQRLRAAWPEQAEAIFAADNEHPPLCLRVNHRQGSRADYLTALRDAGLDAESCTFAAAGLRLAVPCDVETLPGFATGAVSVQDEAAQLAAPLLQLQAGQRVLDACCAPGGKTGHLLEQQPDLAELWALDSSAERLQRVAGNLQRLQLQARLICGDAAQPSTWWDGQLFQRILLDAPCSGTGVIRRHPDIKLLRRPDDIGRLVELQQSLLRAIWPLLAPGGILLYATCSMLPEENTQLLEKFIAETADAEELPIEEPWGLPQPVGRQLLPSAGGCDGFYYARLQKATA